jgi:hypothetical protein
MVSFIPSERSCIVKSVSFWKEFNQRAGFVWVVGITNPIFITIYVMFFHPTAGGMQFFIVGLLLTAAVCLISGSFMSMVIMAERRRRATDARRKAQWHDLMPYNPQEAAKEREAARLNAEAS